MNEEQIIGQSDKHTVADEQAGKTWGRVGGWLAVFWIILPSPILMIGPVLWPVAAMWPVTLAVPIVALVKSRGRFGRWGVGLNLAFVAVNTAYGLWNLSRFH